MPKFRAIHLLTNPKDEREQRSIGEVSSLIRHGVEYFAVINPIYEGELPPARECNDRPFELTKGHYGCWSAHQDAVLSHSDWPFSDGILIFECDALFVESPENFYWRAVRALEACEQGNLAVFTFGPKHNGKTVDTVGDDVIVITQFIETHAYLIPARSLVMFQELFTTKPWDTIDYFYTIYLYDRAKERIGTFKHRATAVQGDGVSLLDGKKKDTERHWRFHRYD